MATVYKVDVEEKIKSFEQCRLNVQNAVKSFQKEKKKSKKTEQSKKLGTDH